ncbi:flexible cuticle protein 12-like [Plutella xylostella]|uniref:flexible cuticle protein 12-like n=1 Tax=Plutella xylostella TaxID=51655 RepID=UPI002032D348|nr:flexible cuticle protein 12-like [Plutella xylostella]
MKLFVVLALVAVTAAAPQDRSARQAYGVQILRYEFDNIGLGQYRYGYEQSNGQRHDETGELKNAGQENESLVVRGSYSWVGPDGVTYTVTYLADNNGYQPTIEQGPGAGVPANVLATMLG